MRFIYAMGQPGRLDFAVTDQRSSVPPHAILLAICTPERTLKNLDEDFFDAMTNEEYYNLSALVNEVEELVGQHLSRIMAKPQVGRFFRWLGGDKKSFEHPTSSGERRMA